MTQSPILKRLSHGRFQGAVYRDQGAGIPVMLIHGFPVDGNLWHYQAERLKKDFRLLIPDLPGSGQSPLTAPLAIEDMAEFLHDILIEQQLAQCICIGHSMGGYIALAFAQLYPDQLLGLGLFHSSAFADSKEKKEGRLRSIELMQQYGAGSFLRQMMPTLFSSHYRRNHTTEMTELIHHQAGANVEALTAYYRAMMERPDRMHILKQTKVPVLFVIGKEDTAAPLKDVLQQVSVPLAGDVQILTDVAHLGMIEKPELSERVLRNFIHLCSRLNLN